MEREKTNAREGGEEMPQEKQSKPGQAAQGPARPPRMVYAPTEREAEDGLPMIVFDLDGTISDSYQLSIQACRQVFGRMGLPALPLDVIESFNGLSADEVCRAMGIGPERRSEFEAFWAEAEDEAVRRFARPFFGAMETLRALEGDASLCLLTNGSASYMSQTLQKFGMAHLFVRKAAFARGMTKADWICRWQKELCACRSLSVGDRETDVRAAHAAGALALGVTYGTGGVGELMEADALAGDMAEVLTLSRRFCREGVLHGTADES